MTLPHRWSGFADFGLRGVAVLGYCLGGTLAWLSAARLPIDAAVGFYGGQITRYLGEQPKVPMMLHFGEQDEYSRERCGQDRGGAL